MYLIRILITILMAMTLHQETKAQTAQFNSCTETDRTKLVTASASLGALQIAEVVPASSRAPAGGPAELVINRLFSKDAAKLTYRIAFQLGESDKPSGRKVRILENRNITTKPVPDGYSLRKSGAVDQGSTLLSFQVPEILASDSLLQSGMITVIGCDDKNEVSFIGHHRTVYSNHVPLIVLTGFSALVLYVLIAAAVAKYENMIREPKLKWYRFLDPVVLSSDTNGNGSIARLQILFFSVLLFCLLFYILIRVGLLSDMSSTGTASAGYLRRRRRRSKGHRQTTEATQVRELGLASEQALAASQWRRFHQRG